MGSTRNATSALSNCRSFRSYDFDEDDSEDDSEANKSNDGNHEDDAHDEKLGANEEETAGDGDSEHAFEAPKSFVTFLSYPDNGRASYIVDLRDPPYRTSSPPTIITRELDNQLYNFLDAATRQTIYHVWYSAVTTYSERRLTFASDKLPAIAGIASRVQPITHDQYLAGHWRRELERLLFWQVSTEPDTWTPARVKAYRAPSWSWASVDGSTEWNFADLAPGQDSPASIEVLEASTEVECKNIFGCVTGGKLIIKASIVRALWDAEKKCWMLAGTFAGPVKTQYGHLHILSSNGADIQVAGIWHYDDVINGILPGPPLSPSNSEDDISTRKTPHGYFMGTSQKNKSVHGKDFMDLPLLERGTYMPEDLMLVKGPVKKIEEYDREEHGGRSSFIEILLLAKTEGAPGEYRRVGVGRLGSWDDGVENVEVLTVI